MPVHKKTARELAELGYHYKVEPSFITKQIRDPVALAIWSYLLSQDENWKIRTKQLMEHFGTGRDKTRAAIKTLIDMGLMVKRKERGNSGSFASDDYDCYALPLCYQPAPDNQGLVDGEKSPAPDIQGLVDETQATEIKDNKNKDANKNNSKSPAPDIQGLDSPAPEKPAPDIQGLVSTKSNPAPDIQGLVDTTQVTENKGNDLPAPDIQGLVEPEIHQRLNIRALNKRSIDQINKKPGGDFFDSVSGQHAYREECNKHDFSNPTKSIPTEVLSPAEIIYFKSGKTPIRFQGGDFTQEQIEEIKKQNGIN